MVQHKSYSQTEGEKELARFMAARMGEARPRERTALRSAMKAASMRSAAGRGSGGGKSLLFNGHVDTNPVTEGWTVDPWAGKVDDNFIYGIGVSNMKAGDAAYFCAVKTLIDAGVKLKGDVILTFVVGELQGGVGTYSLHRAGPARRLFHQLRADRSAGDDHARRGVHLHHRTDRQHPASVEARGGGRCHQRGLRSDPAPQRHEILRRAVAEQHERINRVHVGVVHGALGRELHEWRPPQVADFVRIKGSGRYAPGQTEAGAMADMRRELDALEARFPGPQGRDHAGGPRRACRPCRRSRWRMTARS